MLLQVGESGKRTWAAYIMDILFTHGFGYKWVLHDVGNVNSDVGNFSQRIKDCYTQRRHAYIDESPKAIHTQRRHAYIDESPKAIHYK